MASAAAAFAGPLLSAIPATAEAAEGWDQHHYENRLVSRLPGVIAQLKKLLAAYPGGDVPGPEVDKIRDDFFPAGDRFPQIIHKSGSLITEELNFQIKRVTHERDTFTHEASRKHVMTLALTAAESILPQTEDMVKKHSVLSRTYREFSAELDAYFQSLKQRRGVATAIAAGKIVRQLGSIVDGKDPGPARETNTPEPQAVADPDFSPVVDAALAHSRSNDEDMTWLKTVYEPAEKALRKY